MNVLVAIPDWPTPDHDLTHNQTASILEPHFQTLTLARLIARCHP